MRQPIIDPTRTVTFERDVFGPEAPGVYIVIFDPVRVLQGENGHDILPPVFDTVEEAQAFYREMAA